MRATVILALAAACALTPFSIAPARAAPAATASQGRDGFASVPGGKIHYRVVGDLAGGKTPLLILHGSYMDMAGMKPFADRFAASRPLILVDLRGHGGTGDIPGPITFDLLADDAAAVLKAVGVKKADLFGYSTGAGAAILLAIRHPELVGKLVSVSGSYRTDGLYPEVLAGIDKITPSAFDGSKIRRNYERTSPTPKAFPILVEKLKQLDATPVDWGAERLKAVTAPTMIVQGDYDVIRPEHGVDMFRLRGGGAPDLVSAPFLMKPPPARLAILPGTSHLGIIAQAELVVSLVLPFLDDATPAAPEGFF